MRETPQAVDLGIVAAADVAAFLEIGRKFVGERPPQQFAQGREVDQAGAKAADRGGDPGAQFGGRHQAALEGGEAVQNRR